MSGWILFSAAALVLAVVFAWQTLLEQEAAQWNPDRLVVDTGRFHRYEPDPPSDKVRGEWMQKLAEQGETVRFPADEIRLSWDLVDPEFRKNTVLVLRLDRPDRFQRRCLMDFLQTRQVLHEIDEHDYFDIRLKTKEAEKAQLLIQALATYDLTATLVVLHENKPY